MLLQRDVINPVIDRLLIDIATETLIEHDSQLREKETQQVSLPARLINIVISAAPGIFSDVRNIYPCDYGFHIDLIIVPKSLEYCDHCRQLLYGSDSDAIGSFTSRYFIFFESKLYRMMN